MSGLDDLDEDIDLPDDDTPVVVPHVLQKQAAQQKIQTAVATEQSQKAAMKKPDAHAAKTEAVPSEAQKPPGWWSTVSEQWKPITAAAMVLTFVFGAGVLYGIVLSGHAGLYPYLLASPAAVVLAPLEAPAGVILLLFAAIFCFLKGRDTDNPSLWNLTGWLLLAGFVAGVL